MNVDKVIREASREYGSAPIIGDPWQALKMIRGHARSRVPGQARPVQPGRSTSRRAQMLLRLVRDRELDIPDDAQLRVGVPVAAAGRGLHAGRPETRHRRVVEGPLRPGDDGDARRGGAAVPAGLVVAGLLRRDGEVRGVRAGVPEGPRVVPVVQHGETRTRTGLCRRHRSGRNPPCTGRRPGRGPAPTCRPTPGSARRATSTPGRTARTARGARGRTGAGSR